MLVGHIAVGLAAKRITPRVSLGTTVLAAVLPDLLWCVFLMAGIEHVEIKPGRGAVNYLGASDIAFSHSLLMDAAWGALLAAAYFFARHYARGAWMLFAAVLSHWLLDFVAHRPDMALAPGIHQYFGLGLWNSVAATVIVEGGMWLLAIIVYVRATRPKSRTGVYAFWIVVVLLTLAWLGNIAGPPPRSPRAMAASSLIFFSCVVAWAYWINRLRPACYNSV
jgi:LexA-binding, inner membrane-associated putative hydrolase